MESTSKASAEIVDDDAVAEALRSFVRALGAAAADVRVEFNAGMATLSGVVPSAAHLKAIEDLIAAHDRVEGVASQLRSAGSEVRARQA